MRCKARSSKLDLAGGDGVDAGQVWGKADAGGCWDIYGAVGRDGYFGGDYVLVPVAGAGGDIAGERKIGKCGHGDVVGAANAGFEHAATPDRDIQFFWQRSWMRLRLEMAADPAELDVDDFAGAESDGGFCLFIGVNTFVKADGRLETFLDVYVAEEIVPAEGLLDHHEVVSIELFEEREIFEAIGGVRIDH